MERLLHGVSAACFPCARRPAAAPPSLPQLRVPGLGVIRPDQPLLHAFVLNIVFLFGMFVFAILVGLIGAGLLYLPACVRELKLDTNDSPSIDWT